MPSHISPNRQAAPPPLLPPQDDLRLAAVIEVFKSRTKETCLMKR